MTPDERLAWEGTGQESEDAITRLDTFGARRPRRLAIDARPAAIADEPHEEPLIEIDCRRSFRTYNLPAGLKVCNCRGCKRLLATKEAEDTHGLTRVYRWQNDPTVEGHAFPLCVACARS